MLRIAKSLPLLLLASWASAAPAVVSAPLSTMKASASSSSDESELAPSPCKTYWTYTGSKADCRAAGLTDLPASLDPAAQQLDLSDNNLTALRNGSLAALGLSALELLDAGANALAAVEPDAFRGLRLLRTVRLSDNRLRALHADTFAHNPRLQELFLDGNPLAALPADGAWLRAPLLLVLDASRCGLAALPRRALAALPHLRALYLARNRLRALPSAPGAFAASSALLFLDLSANRLRDLPAGAFSGLGALRRLDLQDNELLAPPAAAFAPLRSLARLELGGNPLACDCALYPLRSWAAARNLSVRAHCAATGAAWTLLDNLDCPA
ncbi:leucine-rich repeat-containing G-protein coupled receptor 6-like [Schistocerca americana]|uniref:leucine-rich repeat-containing G-protein coupled receptor 6-like n=1 Tax=Schistocerca americana TaxID=7009 RepID=UPI001F4F444F|nr:leucine-rich repeat-containing G-protein coupled receptor 6-like [Schistocerca americana]XP_049957727.1 leucine-rich repeat-containing G-protein coupled receptor 6-like [Schistocerca serialis cubense]